MQRCSWVNEANPLYVAYHDEEWGKECHDEHQLYELLILESFQAGLSWEIILKKRENFRQAYDNFDIRKVMEYDQEKMELLRQNPGIVRHRLKIEASITNSHVFYAIQKEFGSFDAYIWSFTNREVIREPYTLRTTSPLSDEISKDLQKRGMKFVGSTIVYSYLQAIGVINGHGSECELCVFD